MTRTSHVLIPNGVQYVSTLILTLTLNSLSPNQVQPSPIKKKKSLPGFLFLHQWNYSSFFQWPRINISKSSFTYILFHQCPGYFLTELSLQLPVTSPIDLDHLLTLQTSLIWPSLSCEYKYYTIYSESLKSGSELYNTKNNLESIKGLH